MNSKNENQEINVIWQPQKGSQRLYLACPIYEVLYDGTRGSQKTDSILMDFAQDVGKGYGRAWRGLLFRRTYKQLDDIIQRTKKWFYQIFPGAKYNESKYVWTFPGKEQLLLRHMDNPDDYWNYHGHEYCIAPETKILTPSGYKPVKSLRIGDEVATPIGTDTISHIFEPTLKNSVTVYFYDEDYRLISQQVQSVKHRLLSNVQMLDLSSSYLLKKYQSNSSLNASWQDYKSLPDVYRGSKEHVSYSTNQGKDDARLKRIPQVFSQLVQLFFLQALQAFYLWSNGFYQHRAIEYYYACKSIVQRQGYMEDLKGARLDLRQLYELWQLALYCSASHVSSYVEIARLLSQGSLSDYHFFYHSNDECFPKDKEIDHNVFQLQGDVVKYAHVYRIVDDSDISGKHNQHDVLLKYPSPYSLQNQKSQMKMNLVKAVFVPCGPRLTMDITVKKHHQYITENGIVNSNSFIGWEELTGWPDDKCYEAMKSCCRSSNPDVPRKYRSTTNSWGIGMNWVKRYFVDPAPPGTIISNNIGEQRVRIHGSILENKVLLKADPEYIKKLDSIKDPNKRKAWRDGSWDITAGGAFDDIWDEVRHVVEPFEIPHSWYVDRSFDWGSARPFSVGWWAESDGTEITLADGKIKSFPRGTIFRIYEFYGWNGTENEGCRMVASEIAQEIKRIEVSIEFEKIIGNRGVVRGPADSSIYDEENNMCIAADMRREGVNWTRANKKPGSRKQGLEKLRRFLKNSQEIPMEKPGLLIFSNCRHFIRTVPVLPRDKRNIEDVATEAEDHAYDETRYRLMSKRYKTREQKKYR